MSNKTSDNEAKIKHPLVSLTLSNSSGSRCCKLCYRSNNGIKYISDVSTPYDADTAAYAACRFIRHSPSIRDAMIFDAIEIGLMVKRPKRLPKRTIYTTAKALELPGGLATITVSLSGGMITVESVRIGR